MLVGTRDRNSTMPMKHKSGVKAHSVTTASIRDVYGFEVDALL